MPIDITQNVAKMIPIIGCRQFYLIFSIIRHYCLSLSTFLGDYPFIHKSKQKYANCC